MSPQFHRPVSAPKRRRQLKRGQLPGKENLTALPPARCRKFTTLAFVGVEISPGSSQTESFNESEDRFDAVNGPQTEMCPRVTRSRATGKNGIDNDNCTRRTTCVPTQLHPTESTDARHCTILRNLSSETNGVDSNIHLATSDARDSPLYETQRKPKTRSTRQSSRRLFSTETPPRVPTVQPSEHETSLLRTPDAYNGASEEPNCDNSVTTPVLNNNRCSRGCGRKTTRAWWLFAETPHKDMCAQEQPVVLAADTPVGDYGLPVRLRNLKYSRMRQNINMSRLHP